jgi:hypothetical protein
VTAWELRLSAYDKQVHAFAPEQGASMWEASCRHSVPIKFMAECPDQLPTCPPCLVVVGHVVAARQEAQRPVIAAAVRQEFADFTGDKAAGH